MKTKKKPYDGVRVQYLHNRIVSIVEARRGLQSLQGFTTAVRRLDAMHRRASSELDKMEQPKNPTWDLP